MMEQMSLFDDREIYNPLASRPRPEDLDGFARQEHLLGKGKLLRQFIEQGKVPSIIFWRSSGVGKTTLADIITHRTHAQFVNSSTVTSGIKEIKDVMVQTEDSRRMGIKTVVLVDEVHRPSRVQQNVPLSYMEEGSIILIGAAAESPSSEINGTPLSRCRVFVLQALTQEDLTNLLEIATRSEKGLGCLSMDIDGHMLDMVTIFAAGDARTALNILEMTVIDGKAGADKTTVIMGVLKQCTGKKSLLYDKKGEEHYNTISVLHKSMRNTDPDVAAHWLTRMLKVGEDSLYVARYLVRFANEDIGMADSRTLPLAVVVYEACHFLDMPECNVYLGHAMTHLSVAPKSNSACVAYNVARENAQATMAGAAPSNIRNVPTKLIEELHYGSRYAYVHDTEQKMACMQCLPDGLLGGTYYHPHEQGDEPEAERWLDEIKAWKAG